MKKKGSISVSFLLFLGVFLMLTGTVFFSARYRGAKAMVKAAARQSMFDLFSRYEPTLFREYDLLFMDLGFGSADFRPGLMLGCVEKNAAVLWGEDSLATNLWGLGKCQAVLQSYTLATDQNGEAFYRQAVEAGKAGLTDKALELLKERINTGNRHKKEGEKKGDVKAACEEYQEALEKAQEGEYEKGAGNITDNGEAISTVKGNDNPIEVVKKLQKKGILGLVMPENSKMSEKKIEQSRLLENRKKETGIGLAVAAGVHTTADHLLFGQYLCDHLSSFTAPDDNAGLSWQLEYVIGGKNNDKSNLKKTVEALLLLREGANLLYLRNDPASMAKVRAMASSIAAGLAVPVGEELIAGVLCVCWAYGESLQDIRTLLAGGRVPLTKDSSSWQLSLKDLSKLGKTGQKSAASGDKGLTYTGYLHILIGMKADRDCLQRGMDMVETGMRSREGCEQFSMDHCLGSAEIEIRASVRSGGTISAKEYRSYEN